MKQQGRDFLYSPTTYVVLSAVTIGTAAALYYLFKCRSCSTTKRKHKGPITLKDPEIKYPLKLISREEVSHDTRFHFTLKI